MVQASEDLAKQRRIALLLNATLLYVVLCPVGCEQNKQTHVSQPSLSSELSSKIEAPTPSQAKEASFELYSTLAGKMARMEELLNAIDRFLDDPDFQDRLVEDAKEFHKLLSESRGRYPKGLTTQDQTEFDETIDQTLVAAANLLNCLQENKTQAARDALKELDKQRRQAHTRFSY